MKREETKKLVKEISKGVVTGVGNLVLFCAYFGFEYAAGASPTSRGVWRAYDKAFEDLESFDFSQIQNALYTLKSQGLVGAIRGQRTRYKITAAGKKKLRSILPVYDEERVWDEKIYLVTYDVPEGQKGDREVLRGYLKKIGCGMLQKSVWLTVYDPSEVLRDFIESRGLSGSVLISSMGKDSSIGQKSIKELMAEVYNLSDLNERYEEYLHQYSGQKNFSQPAAVFDFLSILRDDPQLPFELLPGDWAGDRAYNLFKKISVK
jgi:DNA-binding transcriptional regulator PaaX